MAEFDPPQPLLHGHPLNSGPLKEGAVDLARLAESIGHAFTNAELAAEALTHRSALDRNPELKARFPNGNERLEFLGDRVLSLSMVDLLMRRFPHEREGELARRFNGLVSAGALVEIADEVELSRLVRLGDSEKGADGKVRANILADAVEALLGAVFLDAGFDAAAAVITRLWGERIDEHASAPRDAKTTLQEWAQARRLPLPDYREVGREGPAHAPVFVVDVSIKGQEPARGRAGNKREAERLAAVALLERLDK